MSNPVVSRKRPRKGNVVLLHSSEHRDLTYSTMKYIHKDRDLLLSSLLYCCGFIRETPSFFHVISPKVATRAHLATFHTSDFLDLLEYPKKNEDSLLYPSFHQSRHTEDDAAYLNLLDAYGLTDDCPIPSDPIKKASLWKYCLSVVGASLHAAHLVLQGMQDNPVDVAINWSGGRHHAHSDKAGGFCFVNDIVIATKKLIKAKKKVLYLDIDIHHSDGVQSAFYDTDQVLTVSLHRYVAGFFPSKSGSTKEKGKDVGLGYNCNLPMPRGCRDCDLIDMVSLVLSKIGEIYDPDIVVLVVGADGLKSDDLVKDTNEGWNLTPEGLAECVRRVSCFCFDNQDESDENKDKFQNRKNRRRKLILLGGGGYNPANTARTFLLCTAAACESSRSGMLWKHLPKDIPHHKYFERYGPSFELIRNTMEHIYSESQTRSHDANYAKTIKSAKEDVILTSSFLSSKMEKPSTDKMFSYTEDSIVFEVGKERNAESSNKRFIGTKGSTVNRRRRRK